MNFDGQLVIQKRSCSTPPGALTTFGGKIEFDESIEFALIRELNEELGAVVNSNELTALGAVTEIETNHTEIIYCYFWQDSNNTIAGCYEGEVVTFSSSKNVIEHPRTMNYVKWFLNIAIKKGLVGF